MANRNVNVNVVAFLEKLVEITVEAHQPKAIGARDSYQQWGQLSPGRKGWAVRHAKVNQIKVPKEFADVPLFLGANVIQRVEELPPAAPPVPAEEDVALLISHKFSELAELFRRMS